MGAVTVLILMVSLPEKLPLAYVAVVLFWIPSII